MAPVRMPFVLLQQERNARAKSFENAVFAS
jgi:hypothetical protein